MRRLLPGVLALVVVVVGGCNTAAKKGATFIFGPTESGEWLAPDCFQQLDKKEKD